MSSGLSPILALLHLSSLQLRSCAEGLYGVKIKLRSLVTHASLDGNCYDRVLYRHIPFYNTLFQSNNFRSIGAKLCKFSTLLPPVQETGEAGLVRTLELEFVCREEEIRSHHSAEIAKLNQKQSIQVIIIMLDAQFIHILMAK